MTISRKLLAWLVVLGGWADIVITLIGQIGYTTVREDDPFSKIILIQSPIALFIVGFLFHALCGYVVYKSNKWISIPLALIMLTSAFVALFFWSMVLGVPYETISSAIWFAPIIAIILYAISTILDRFSKLRGRSKSGSV